jgi:hypothetical protein
MQGTNPADVPGFVFAAFRQDLPLLPGESGKPCLSPSGLQEFCCWPRRKAFHFSRKFSISYHVSWSSRCFFLYEVQALQKRLKFLAAVPITISERCGKRRSFLVPIKEILTMSITGISGSSFIQALLPASAQTKAQQLQQEFQQLGQDLQSGNLSQAQSDFATLQQNAPAGSPFSATATAASSTSASSSSLISQAFSQLAQDLKSGNLSGAQSDFAAIQQDAQQNAAQGAGGHHHHHHHVEQPSQSPAQSGPSSALDQAFGQLGQALQSGNLQSAQQSYATLQQDFQQFAALGSGSNLTSSGSSPQGSLNISA